MLYYYRARYYSTAVGRFLQADPIGVKDDLNLYAYVGGDPTNATDPMGMEREDSNGGNGGDTDTDKEKNKQAGPSLGCQRSGGGCQTTIMSLGNANKNFTLKMKVEKAINEYGEALENMATNGETEADRLEGATALRTHEATVYTFEDDNPPGSCPTACANYLDGTVKFRASEDMKRTAAGVPATRLGVKTQGLRDMVAHEGGHLRPRNYELQVEDLGDRGNRSEHDANQWMIRLRQYYR